eukprot:13892567-Ditylum_brightwellii.AAC.1
MMFSQGMKGMSYCKVCDLAAHGDCCARIAKKIRKESTNGITEYKSHASTPDDEMGAKNGSYSRGD